MWPFDRLRKRKYDRRYKAALVVLLGKHMFAQLEAALKARVESEMNANFSRSNNPAAAWRRWAHPDYIAAFRAAAMERIGIEPPIPGLSWAQLFKPWAHWRKWPQWPLMRGFDNRAAWLVLDFRPMDKATHDAREFLRSNALAIPGADGSARAMHVAV
jgi:hypothetical protein